MTAWLLVFLVHSSLWLCLAWLLTRTVPSINARLRETIWYTAIAASLVVSTIHVCASVGFTSLWTLPFPGAGLSSHDLELAASTAGAHSSGLVETWLGYGAWFWMVISAALLLRYVVRLSMLRRFITARDFGPNSPQALALTRLCRHAGLRRPPRLTESENLGSPIVIGFGRHTEICVPTRALHDLDGEQFSAMLGHEVAHLLRRDPVRLTVLSLLQNVFFFQPLFLIAGRDVHFAAEAQCDAWAASYLEDHLAMASCLTEVACWLVPQDSRLPVAGMARSRSQLVIRVNRLMNGDLCFNVRGRTWRWIGSASVLLMAPWLAPTVIADDDSFREVSRVAVVESELTGVSDGPLTPVVGHDGLGDEGRDHDGEGNRLRGQHDRDSSIGEYPDHENGHGGRESGGEHREEGEHEGVPDLF